MNTTTRKNIFKAHGLSDCVAMSLPPLLARNHPEAVAALKARQAALLEHAEHLTFLASLFTDTPDVCDAFIAECKATLAESQALSPKGGAGCSR